MLQLKFQITNTRVSPPPCKVPTRHILTFNKHCGGDATQHRVGRVPWRGIPALSTDTFADRPQADELPERVAKGLVDDAVEDEVEGEVEDLHEVGEVQGDVHLVAVHGRA